MFQSVQIDGRFGISLIKDGKVQPPFLVAATAGELQTMLTNAARAIALQVPVGYGVSAAPAPSPEPVPPPVAPPVPEPADEPAPDEE